MIITLNYFLIVLTVCLEPSFMCNVIKYIPCFNSPKWISVPGLSITFTNLPETSDTVTDFTLAASEIFSTSANGFGYTLILF